MDKEEVLRRVQDEGEHGMDEMHEYIERTGCRYSVLFGGAACLILMIAKISAGILWYDVYSIWGIMAGSMHFYTWRRTKETSSLRLALAWLGVGVIFGFCYIFRIVHG